MSESLYQRLLGMRPRGGPMAEELRRAPMSGPRQAFANARRPAIPGVQPPAERNDQTQAEFYTAPVTAPAPLAQYQDGPGAGAMGRSNPMGSMPQGPISEEPAVGGANPYARARQRVPLAMGQPPAAGGADDLNAMVMAILDGTAEDNEETRRMRQYLQMASGPQQGGLY